MRRNGLDKHRDLLGSIAAALDVNSHIVVAEEVVGQMRLVRYDARVSHAETLCAPLDQITPHAILVCVTRPDPDTSGTIRDTVVPNQVMAAIGLPCANREGNYNGFPANQGAHLRLWVATYLNPRNAEVRKEMERILSKVLDVQIARTKKYGFVPFTFDPDYKGKDPGKSPPGQSIRLANHAAELSRTLSETNAAPEIAAKLKQLAVLHLGHDGYEKAAGAGGKDVQIPKPEPRVKVLSQSRTPSEYANEILRTIEYYKRYGDDTYLKVADTYARLAYITFSDDVCPLPKAYAGSSPSTMQGEPFPDFYFRGAKLMHAFALLGEAN